MRYLTTRVLLVSGFMLFLSIANSEAIGQVAQAPQSSQKSFSEKDMQEIEEMRRMVRERKMHQDEQKQILKDLENAIANFSKETGSANKTSQVATTNRTSTSVASTTSLPANYYDAGRPGFVTSESVLSRLDAMEQLRAARTQYEIDIKAAQREIELLRKQLDIANDQIDRYQRAMTQVDEPDIMPVYEQQRTLAQQPDKKSKKENKNKKQQQPQQEVIFAEPATSSLNSGKNKQVMEEIEMMKQQLRERKERQAQQQREMQELLQMAQTK